jgi:hypothetical protein
MANIGANGMVNLDSEQVIRSQVEILSSGDLAQKVAVIGGNLVPKEYDEISLTYVTIGNGIGEIETVTYKYQTVTVAILTLSYDPGSRLINVIRS